MAVIRKRCCHKLSHNPKPKPKRARKSDPPKGITVKILKNGKSVEAFNETGTPIKKSKQMVYTLDNYKCAEDFKKCGSFGAVYKAINTLTNQTVAVKHIKCGRSLDTDREIQILTRLQGCPSIVELKHSIVEHQSNLVCLVMEYIPKDLQWHINKRVSNLTRVGIKFWMKQLLIGVDHIHSLGYVHRDLKPGNILVQNDGTLRICDFGLSRSILEAHSSEAGTMLYCAPEILLGMKNYTTAVDMWSVGCILAEMLTGKPVFLADSVRGVIERMFMSLGTPDESEWPEFHSTFEWNVIDDDEEEKDVLRNKAINLLGMEGTDLLYKMLTFDPSRRITAEAALEHPWFKSGFWD